MIRYIMIYSIQRRDGIYIKGYGFVSFSKNVAENLSSKYAEKILNSTKKKKKKKKKKNQ